MEAQARHNVTMFCKVRKLDLLKPSKGSRDILVMDWSTGFGKVIAEGTKWSAIVDQLRAYRNRMEASI
jgi:hypothetical protein